MTCLLANQRLSQPLSSWQALQTSQAKVHMDEARLFLPEIY